MTSRIIFLFSILAIISSCSSQHDRPEHIHEVSSDSLLVAAIEYMNAKEFAEASSRLSELLRSEPLAKAHKLIAFCYSHTLEYQKASKHFQAWNKPSVTTQDSDVSYCYLELDDNELVALVNDTFYPLIPSDYSQVNRETGGCFDIIHEGDINNNGYSDVLIEHRRLCGGSSGYSDFQAICFDGETFHHTDPIGYNLSGYHEVIDLNGKTYLVFDSYMPGTANYSLDTFILKNQNLSHVSDVK